MTEPGQILIAEIDVENRLRDLDLDVLNVIVRSFAENGQKNAIQVKRKPDGRFRLVAGLHRLEAAKALKWPSIIAVEFEGDESQARLWEIDENLARVELSALDQANFMAERREIWERVYGEVRRGGDRRQRDKIVPLAEAIKRKGFFADTAERFGLNQKLIKRALTRRAQISPALWQALKNTDAAKNAALLDKLRKLDLDTQEHVLFEVQSRGCTVGEAVRLLTAKPPRKPEDVQFEALVAAWEKATPEVRKKFLAAKAAKK